MSLKSLKKQKTIRSFAMIKITNKNQCSGCYACVDICPKNCISMICDGEGFKYPNVDKEQCIRCGLCEKACPIINKNENKKCKPLVLAAINKDEETRLNSSSGGVFTLFAKEIIKNGGIVFGAAFTDNFKSVEHIAVTKIEDLSKLRGSKYLQSQIRNSYKEAKDYLEKGLPVYFSGTPCQIAGLYAFLGKNYENLVTQDIICHGVPSPLVWKKYLEYREAKAGSKTHRIFFRHKKSGWKTYSMHFRFENGTDYTKVLTEDLYMKGFLSNLFLRPSCHNCSFKTVSRVADITLADFWGIEKTNLNMDDDKGTSLVLIHTNKGKKLLEQIHQHIYIEEVDLEFIIKHNSAIVNSSVAHRNREKFFNKLKTNHINHSITKCLKIPLHIRIISKIKRIMRKFLSITKMLNENINYH